MVRTDLNQWVMKVNNPLAWDYLLLTRPTLVFSPRLKLNGRDLKMRHNAWKINLISCDLLP